MALQNLKKVIGVEMDRNLIDIVRRNLNNLKKSNTAIELIHTDAATYKITEENIFFHFGIRIVFMTLKRGGSHMLGKILFLRYTICARIEKSF